MNLSFQKNRILWTPSESTLPMQTLQRSSVIGGIVVSLFAAAWFGGLLTMIVLATLKEGPDIAMSIMMLLFASPGALFLYFGLSMIVSNRGIFITRENVQVTDRSLFRKTDWLEPLSGYTGVLRKMVYYSGGKGHSSRTDFLILLAHADIKKQIPLFQSPSSKHWHAASERFADVFQLALLEETQEGIVQVRTDSSVRAPRQENPLKKQDWQDLTGAMENLGRRIQLIKKNNAYTFRLPLFWDAWKTLLGFLMSVAIAGVAVSFREQHPDDTALVVMIGLMIGFAVLFMVGFVSALISREELIVTPSKISYCKKPGRRNTAPAVIYPENIAEVSIKRDPKRPAMSSSLTLKGGDTVIRCGSSLSKKSKHNFKKAFIVVLSDVLGKDMRYLELKIVLPDRKTRWNKKAAVFVGVALIFFIALAVTMHFAFDEKPSVAPSEKNRQGVQPARLKPGLSDNLKPDRIGNQSAAKNRERMREWVTLYKAGQKDYYNGDLSASRSKLERALAIAEGFGDTDTTLVSTLSQLGFLAEKEGRFRQAVLYAIRALDIRKKRNASSDILARQTITLARRLAKAGQSNAADRRYREAIHLATSAYGKQGTATQKYLKQYDAFLKEMKEPALDSE
ncbi:MAG: tetratricopeptide repeat protein [Deltaproteobacteria bacterium]|nr:tetratricopeptide repeat protein [Deltaproteobacteria bacterium]